MSGPLTGWILALFLVAFTAWLVWSAFRACGSTTKLLIEATVNTVAVLLLANAVAIPWNSVIPLWLWWLAATLLAVYLGALAYHLLTRENARSVESHRPTPNI